MGNNFHIILICKLHTLEVEPLCGTEGKWGFFLHLNTTPLEGQRCVCSHLKGYFADWATSFWLNNYWITQWMLCFLTPVLRSLLWWQISHYQRSLQIGGGGQDRTSVNVNRGLPCTPQMIKLTHRKKSTARNRHTGLPVWAGVQGGGPEPHRGGVAQSVCVFWCEALCVHALWRVLYT